LIFLDRESAPQFNVTRMPEGEAAAHLERDVLETTAETLRPQLDAIQSLVGCRCWGLQYGGAPDAVAEKLISFFWDR